MNQGLATEGNNIGCTIQEGSGVMRIGELLVKEGFVKSTDIDQALPIQRKRRSPRARWVKFS